RVAERAAQRLRGFLELWVMVALGLDVVADPGLWGDQRTGVRAALLPAVGAALNFAHSGVEPGNAFRDRRRIVGKLNQLVAADPEVGEHRVGEDLAQLRRTARLAGSRRVRFRVDSERLRKAQKNARSNRPLVALEVIEIGPRNSELVGHLALVE